MNKYIFGDMATDKLKRELDMVAQPLPEEIRLLDTVHTSRGRVRFEPTLYRSEKLKKISIVKHAMGDGAGTLVLMIADDQYDLPFILADVSFDFGVKGKILADFEAKPLIKDEESTRKYVDPFRNWRKAMSRIPAEPAATVFGEDGAYLVANASPNKYSCVISSEHSDKVLKLADQFFDIFVDVYRKAEPVKDAERKKKMKAFRSEYNKHVMDEDISGPMLASVFGQQRTQIFYDYLVNL